MPETACCREFTSRPLILIVLLRRMNLSQANPMVCKL